MIQHRLPRLQFCICFWQWIKWRQIRYSHIYCVVCVCVSSPNWSKRKKSVFVWAVTRALWLPAFECRCHAEFAPSWKSETFPSMSVGCILGSSQCLLSLFFLTVKMNGCIVDLAFSGEPKAIPWTHVAPLWCSTDAWAHQDIRYGDVFAWPTNLGWMMGPYLIFGSFLNGATIALYNGAPHGHSFGKFVQVCATYWNSFVILTVLHFILILI